MRLVGPTWANVLLLACCYQESDFSDGQCCNFQAAAQERHDAGVASDCNLEQPSDEMELANNLTDAHPPRLPLPNRMHRFVTLDRAVGSPERTEALARSRASLDGPMILLQEVIKVLHRPQSTSTPQRAF